MHHSLCWNSITYTIHVGIYACTLLPSIFPYATPDGTEKILLEDVRYCPGAGVNLASLSKFLKRGAEIRGKGEVCELEKNGEVFLKAVEEDGLLIIQEERRSGIRAFPAVEQEKAELWHRRFCHAGYETLAVMAQEELVEEMSVKAEDFRKIKSSLCEPCVLRKQVRKPFHSSERESKEPLELIHIDVCGPMQTKTPGGNRFFVSFIDDHSRCSVIQLLQHKHQVKAALESFVNRMETQFDKKVKAIQSDRGGEFWNKKIDSFCRSKGICNGWTS
jgi:hypothetical protein